MKQVFLPLFITLASLALICFSSSRRCLESRLDYRQCSPEDKVEPSMPNHYKIHRTKLTGTECEIIKTSKDKEIADFDTEEMRIVYSPGFIRSRNYSHQQLVHYNVKCGNDTDTKLVFFNITDMDLQGDGDCSDNDNNPICEDYILIDRGPYGTDEFCGNNIPEINPKNLARGGVKIKFRSSERIRERGFRMYILCFTDSKRSKRNINIGERCFNVNEFNSEVCTKSAIQKLNNIKYTKYDVFSNPTYSPNCKQQNPLQIFQRKRVQGRSCHPPKLPLNSIEPNGNLPTKEEQVELTQMTTSFLNSVPDELYQDNEINDTYDPLEKNISESQPPKCRDMSNIPRIVNGSREIGNEGNATTAFFAALRNQNACNPVLRAQANAILTYFRNATHFNQAEMEALKKFPINCTQPSNCTLSCQSDSTTLPGRTLCIVPDETFTCEPFAGEPVNITDYKGKTMKVRAVNCNGQQAEAVIQLNIFVCRL